MSKAPSISEMSKFRFGSVITCTDGETGILSELFIDPATRRLISIGIKQGRIFSKTAYAAFEQIVSASSGGIALNVKRGELAIASPSGASLGDKCAVERAASSQTGTLKLVAAHPENGELAYIVAHNLRADQDTMLRAEFVTAIASNLITVTISDDTLNSLSPYRSDAELRQDVEAVLFDIGFMHYDLKAMTVRVQDGVLYLDGSISSALRSDIAQDQVSGVEGLLEIHNNLVADDTLAADIAMALGQDKRTRGLPIGVYPRLGEVRLSGAVRHAQQREAAEEIARTFPGVRSVLANMVIDPNADMLPVMSSSEGGEMEDKVPGKYVRHTQ